MGKRRWYDYGPGRPLARAQERWEAEQREPSAKPPRRPGHRLDVAGGALIGFGKFVMGLGLLLIVAAVAFSLLRG